MNKKQKRMAVRIAVTAGLLVLLHFLPVDGIWDGWLKFALYLIPYGVIGYDILRKAVKGVKNRQPTDECFLMAVATLGALVLGRVQSGDYVEGVAVMLFYQIGELFQSVAVGKSRRSISALMDIRPDTARLLREDGTDEEVSPDEVEVGSVIVVGPGERVPIDGVVVEGESTLDTAALTGESRPRTIRPGDEALSGCVSMTGVVRIRTTRAFEESTASRVLDMVENASSRKSRSEAFITRFARVYTPAVCLCALALALLGPLVRLALGMSPDWLDWLMRALTFLVISCPCALVISIPLTFFGGIGGASRAGVLVKGSNYLEALSTVRTVVFDKTGTMTEGVFEVAGIHHAAIPEEQLLDIAAHAEAWSTHPISLSLQRALGHPVDKGRVTDVREVSGAGVLAKVDGREIAVGNERLMAQAGVECDPCHSVGTVVHIAADGQYCGHVLIADRLKPHAAQAVAALGEAGAAARDADRRPEECGRGRRGGAGRGHRLCRAAPAGQGDPAGGAAAGQGKGRDRGLRGRRHQRRAGALPGRCGHRHGRAGQRRRHRGRRRGADGRRSPQAAPGHRHRAQVHAHRPGEHRLRHRREAGVPGGERPGPGQHVAGDLRGCGRDGARRAERHPGPARAENVTQRLDRWRLSAYVFP